MSKGLIVVAYQGMGKTTLSSNNELYLDLESSMYPKVLGWEKKYVDDAVAAVEINGYSICFMSSHKAVRDELVARGKRFIILYPMVDKETMSKRLANRYFTDRTIKNASALANCVLDFENNIQDLKSYNNSIGCTDGFINKEFLNKLSELTNVEYNMFIQYMTKIKEKAEATK